MYTLTKRDGHISLLLRPWKCPSRCYTQTCCPGCQSLPVSGYWSRSLRCLSPKSWMTGAEAEAEAGAGAGAGAEAEAERDEERRWPCCPLLRAQEWTQDRLQKANMHVYEIITPMAACNDQKRTSALEAVHSCKHLSYRRYKKHTYLIA